MKSLSLATSVLAGAAFLASSAAADASTIPKIVTKGKHFFYANNGSEFFIRGMAYQQDYSANASNAANSKTIDPLADPDACKRDIPYLLQVRTNAIRTYAVDPTQNHDECMNAFADAGIYVFSDLSTPSESIDTNAPAWTDALFAHYTAVIDDLSQYNNVVGFFAGNEIVTNLTNTTGAAAYAKAAVRDSKAYIKEKGYGKYVGYATEDSALADNLADYFNCGDQSDAVDFWGYNIYEWCGNSSYTQSGYAARTDFFRDYSVPTFFAEYGCIQVLPRYFTEIGALFGINMTPVWSGGFVYSYFPTVQGFGLVTISDDGKSVNVGDSWSYLIAEQSLASPSSTAMSNINTATLTPTTCPAVDATFSAAATPLPPPANGQLCECLVDSLSCVVADNVNPDAYGDVFGYIYGHDAELATAINHNATTGKYGPYSGCSDEEKLAFLMDQYYSAHNQVSSNCDFNGVATLRAAASPSGSCSSLLSVAGNRAGTGTVPFPTGTVVTPSGAQGSAANTGAASSSSIAAAGTSAPSSSLAAVSLLLYVSVAGISGIGMLFL